MELLCQNFTALNVVHSPNAEQNFISNLNGSFQIDPLDLYFQNFERVTFATLKPNSYYWCLEPLFKIDAHGNTRIWWIGTQVDSQLKLISYTGTYKTQDGNYGKIIAKLTPITLNSSGRDVIEQSFLEGKQKYNVKFRKGYRRNGEDFEWAFNSQPSLATVYKPERKLKTHVYGSIKFDGIRLRMFQDSNGMVKKYSRNNMPFPFLTKLTEEGAELLRYFPVKTVLDGELVVAGKTCQKIASIVSVKRIEPHPEEDQVNYLVYDIFVQVQENLTFEERLKIINESYAAYKRDHQPMRIQLVEHIKLHKHEEFIALRDFAISHGYEGAIIRLADKPYKPGRSCNMFKLKTTQDAEGKIIAIDEQPKNPGMPLFLIQAGNGKVFWTTINADEGEQREMFARRAELIGLEITYYMKGLTDDGVPREPKGKKDKIMELLERSSILPQQAYYGNETYSGAKVIRNYE